MDFDNDMVQRLKNRLGEEIRRLENSSDGTLDGASLPTMPSEEREDHLSGNNSPQVSNINNTQPQHSTDFPGKKDTSDLLEEAFMEIKNEREISQRLREELQKVEQASKFDQEEMIMLQQQVETLRELIDPMKKKICELSLTASFAIEQLAVYRMRDEYQSEQAPLPQPPPPPRRSYDSSVNYPPTGRPPTIDNHHQQTSSRHPQHSSRHHQQASHPPVVPVAVVAPPVAQKTHQQHTDHLMERMRRAFAPPPKYVLLLHCFSSNFFHSSLASVFVIK